jgi:site-specific DNA recombinase
MYVWKDRRNRVYACTKSGGHLCRSQNHLDKYVEAMVLERLATVDFSALAAEHPDAAEARAEAAELHERLDAAAAEYSAGRLSASMLGKVEADLVPRVRQAERRVRAAVVPPNLEQFAGAGVDRRWKQLTVEQCRDVIRLLVDVTVLPSTRPRGSTGFDPDAVRLEWRT